MQTFMFEVTCLKRVVCKQTMLAWLTFVCTIGVSFSAPLHTQFSVSGRVTDDQTGESLPGVHVVIKETANGVSTDADGYYTIQTDAADAVLVFTFVGYITQEIVLNAQTVIDVRLVPDNRQLDEVIVVGYGTVRKEGVTAAIDQIAGKVIEKRPVANLFQGLQGLSPGLNINYAGGNPGAVPKINIRGVTTLTGDGAQPLIVINGIASTTDDILRLNPSDIASITVLRDAASAAIYGARAAFGVILINTKDGLEGGKQRISYNNYFSFSKPTIVPRQITDPYIFSKVLEISANNTPWDYVNYTDYQYQWARERSDNPSVEDVRTDPSDPSKWIYMGGYDWNKFFFHKTGFSQNHSISFSGGTTVGGKNKPLSYYVSADYTKENGLNKLAKDQWDRYGFRSRLNYSPTEHLKIDNNLNVYQFITTKPTRNITDIYYLKPTDVAQNPDGTWANTGAGRLAAQMIDGGQNLTGRFGFQNILQGTLSVLNNQLQITGRASHTREFTRVEGISKKYQIGYGPKDIREDGGDGSVSITNGNQKHDVYDLFASYSRTFMSAHALTALLGYNQEEYVYASEKATKNVLISSSLPYIGLTTGPTPTVEPTYTTFALRSVFGRLNYTYREKYVLELNGRSDGSSRFPKEKRYGFFPSISGAWIVSRENFFEPVQRAVPNLKFRASYGDLGNQSVSDFGYIQTLPTKLSSYPINNSKQTVVSGAPSLRVDPANYTWERVRVLNIGTDIGLLKNSLQIGVEYFVRRTIGMLGPISELPGVLGTNTPTQNVADLKNNGYELTISYSNSFNVARKPFNYNVKVNFWDSRAVITKYKNDQKLLNTYREGQRIGEIWGLENDGHFQSENDVRSLNETAIVPWGALTIVPGWPKYVDQNGDHRITRGNTYDNPGDLKIIGNSSDRCRFGVTVSLDWNNFDFSMFVQGIGKRDFYPQNYLFWGPLQQPYAGIYPWNLDFYRASSESPADRARNSNSYNAAGLADANTNSYYPVLQAWLADDRTGLGLAIPQTKYLLNGAYARLKNLTIGYTLPSAKTKKLKIERLRLFFTGENLLEVSSVKKYIDPEAINAGSSAWAYPFQRKFAFGLNLDF